MSQEPTAKVFFESRCPNCRMVLSSPKSLLNHMRTKHQIYMDSRAPSLSRPRDNSFRTVPNKSESTEIRISCPSCWFHCSEDEFPDYVQHVQEHTIAKSWDNYLALGSSDDQTVMNYPPEDSNVDQSRITKQNEILDIMEKLTNSFKTLFSTAKYN